jgi:hypothetical protein
MTDYALGLLAVLLILGLGFIIAIRDNPLAARVAFDRFVAAVTPEYAARTSNHIAITRPYHVKDGRILVTGTPVVYRDRTMGTLHTAAIYRFSRLFDGDFYEMSDGATIGANDVWEPVELPRSLREEAGFGKVAIA